MKNQFNELHWHDAVLLDIHIDRNDPGNVDEVSLVICWPDETKSKVSVYLTGQRLDPNLHYFTANNFSEPGLPGIGCRRGNSPLAISLGI